MLDLNDLRVFERVAALNGFSPAAAALGMPKSTASRAVARLEAELGIRLFQRTTRSVALTAAGKLLFERSRSLLEGLDEAAASTAELAKSPRGRLSVSAGIGFGVNVLAAELSGFLTRFPEVSIAVDLTSRNAELVSERVDVAIRMGELSDSTLVAVRLGVLTQYLCATRGFLDAHGRASEPSELTKYQAVAFVNGGGRPHPWRLTREGRTETIEPGARVAVNDALTISRLVRAGAGVGAVTAYLCADDVLSGDVERILPEWSLPSIPVNLIFPSKREISPAVRAFVAYMRERADDDATWLRDPLA